jgi:cytochrome b involved in lipid metabolism
MLKFLLYTLFVSVLGLNCYTKQDVINNNYVSYRGKIYDLTDYNDHPAGRKYIDNCLGQPLENFFSQSRYRFHINSKKTNSQLSRYIIGDLKSSCSEDTEPTTDPTKEPVIFKCSKDIDPNEI